MHIAPFAIESNTGTITLDPTAIYQSAKSAFLTDYADDDGVVFSVLRNGDMAEREFAETIKGLSVDRCAAAAPKDIRVTVANAARSALCRLALGYKR